MAGEPTSISWESLHHMFDESPQMETAPHRSYSLTSDTNSQAARNWPNFDAATESPRPDLPDEARLGVAHAIMSSIEAIRETYKRTAFETFNSKEGRVNLADIAKNNSDHNKRFYFIQQLIKEIINKVQDKNIGCTYSEAIDMWQGECPALRNLDLPRPEDLLLEGKESEPTAETIRNKDIPTEDKAMEEIESALNSRLDNGPLARLGKALADLKSY